MRHWLQLATRSWRTRAGRTALAVLAITLGVGVVVWVTCCYESVRRGVTNVVLDWIGRSHVVVESTAGVWGVFDEDVREWVKDVPGIRHVTVRTREYVEAAGVPRGVRESNSGATTQTDETLSGEPTIPDRGSFIRIEVTGIEPENEQSFRSYNIIQGKMLSTSDRRGAVLESLLARQLGVGIGDVVFLRDTEEERVARPYTVVGILDRRRLA
ncbi:MAG: ABC transporter permease [Planctomycetes bacterium]|nr:ABC transporter permease [Planctomycetota bacterium]